ncbi:class I SAM-dependent methyltransferase [bacterium]|nr:class I SAM-dependent methyltransferase [candidate division CSSED10-310 bacterium]
MSRSSRIAKGIREAHDRVAGEYGLRPIDGFIDAASYDSWNLQNNVIAPLSCLLAGHLLGGTVLETGCGNGQISEIVLESGVARVVGVDFSEAMLTGAVQRMRRAGLSHRFSPLRADLDNLDMIKRDSFDAAVLFGVLEHLDHPDQVIANVLHTIRPGGIFIVAVPRKYSLSHLSFLVFGESPNRWGKKSFFYDRFRWREKSQYYRFFSRKDIQAIMSRCPAHTIVGRTGFAHVHLDGTPGWILRWLGRHPPWGHRALSRLEKLTRGVGFIPAGEYWVLRKENQSAGKSPGES